MSFVGSKVDCLLLDMSWIWTVYLAPQLYNRRHYPMSPADNAVSVDRKEEGEKEKERLKNYCFTRCISEDSVLEMWIKG